MSRPCILILLLSLPVHDTIHPWGAVVEEVDMRPTLMHARMIGPLEVSCIYAPGNYGRIFLWRALDFG